MDRYNYFPGCTLKTTGIELERSAIKVSRKLGLELVELPRWHCCGTVAHLQTDNKMHSLGAIRTLIRAQETGEKKLLTLCSICYNTLRRVNDRFNNDADFRDAILKFIADDEPEYKGEIEPIHFMQVIEEIGFQRIEKAVVRPLKNIKVSAYYGCLLLRPNKFSIDRNPEEPAILEKLIEFLGAKSVRNPYKIECCGSYEVVHNTEQVAGMVFDIVEGARQNGADVIITSCPLCHFNLDTRQKIIKYANPQFEPMPILYFTQLMELAMLEEKPIWRRHDVDTNVVVKKTFAEK